MNRDAQARSYRLERNAQIVLDHVAGAVVCCRGGAVWLTQYGDSRDTVLEAGDCFPIERGTVIVIAAIRPAQLQVLMPAPVARQRAPGWAGWLRRLLTPRWQSAANARLWMRNSNCEG